VVLDVDDAVDGLQLVDKVHLYDGMPISGSTTFCELALDLLFRSTSFDGGT